MHYNGPRSEFATKKVGQRLGHLFEYSEFNREVVSNGWMAGLEWLPSRNEVSLNRPLYEDVGNSSDSHVTQ